MGVADADCRKIEKNKHAVETHGCEAKWCADIPELNFAQFIVGTGLVGVGYPAASAMIYSLFSLMLPPTKQGVMMGWLTAAGSLSRFVGPIVFTFLYADVSGRCLCGVVCWCLYVLCVC